MNILVVAKYRLRGRGERRIVDLLRGHTLTYVSVDPLKRVADGDEMSKTVLKQLRDDFDQQSYDVDGILALGNEALYVTTGQAQIMKRRGTEMSWHGIPLIATVSPAAVERNPSQASLLTADVSALLRYITGAKPREGVLPTKVRAATSKQALRDLLSELRDADAIAFDLETSGFDEFAEDSTIICMSVSLARAGQPRSADTCWAIPLAHRASVWATRWKTVLRKVAEAMREVPVRIAHNGKFDCRWLAHFDAPVPCNFDTMLAAHLLDENRQKGLKILARVLLDAPEWDIQIKSSMSRGKPWYEAVPFRDTMKYCALDTWHTLGLYHLFARELDAEGNERTNALFRKMVMPASQSLVHIERRGVYVDRAKLRESSALVTQELERIEGELNKRVPYDAPYAINWNPSTFLRWFMFEHLDHTPLKYGKAGAPSLDESTMAHLAQDGSEVAKLLLERVRWNKFRTAFINPYNELITPDSRLRTTFKLSGTVTGRLSSGKADADKVTGFTASKMRGVNLQQVPRDPVIRGVFGAAPGWTFVEADYSQVELRIAAELAQERTMLGLYARGEDIHMAMAVRMTGKPASQVTKEERKKAKAVNFGFLYGMGANKFVSTAFDNYGVTVTEYDAKLFRTAFFEQFPGLMPWHARQRKLAHKYKRVQSPFGRVRHLPDIDSLDPGVVSEAERQAINSPVQATASDMCLASLVVLDRMFRKRGMKAAPIGTVHDAINFEVPDDELPVALPLIKQAMENLNTTRMFGYTLRVPIVADVAIGSHWGTKTEIPGDIVSSPSELRQWLNER
ncbi:DNA polymerase I [Gordonia phage Margaret]|nr:DNA polymerase I [Gordonia phage Margaret]